MTQNTLQNTHEILSSQPQLRTFFDRILTHLKTPNDLTIAVSGYPK